MFFVQQRLFKIIDIDKQYIINFYYNHEFFIEYQCYHDLQLPYHKFVN